MNQTAIGIIIGILATLVAALARLYLSARGDAIRAEVMLRTEHILREEAASELTVTRGALDGTRTSLRQSIERAFFLECELQRIIATRTPPASAPALDDQTKALVRLATSNPNEHERNAAALLVCKRLREKIDA